MSNSIQVWNAWCALSMQTARLGWEVQSVIALRLLALCRAKLVEKPDGSAPHGNGESGGTRRSAGRDGRGRRQKRQEPSYREEGFGRLQEARPGQQATPDENIVSKAITDRNRT